MDFKEIVEKYQSEDSTVKLGILSNVITLFTAALAIITSQVFSVKYFEVETVIKIAFYIGAMGLSLFVLFFYLKWGSYILQIYKSLLLQLSIILFGVCSFILFMAFIWGFVLSIQ